MLFVEPVTDETASGFDCIATADIDQILQQLTLGEKVAARYSRQCLLQEIEGLAPSVSVSWGPVLSMKTGRYRPGSVSPTSHIVSGSNDT